MTDARTLVEETRAQLQPIEAKMSSHPYLAAIEAGGVSPAGLRRFAGEQYRIINSDLRSIALLLNRHADLPSRGYLIDSLQGEAAAREALLAFADALGMSADDLRAYEPLPACQAYPAYVAWLALFASDAEFAGAFLVNLPAWGGCCGRMSEALQERYGLRPEDVQFFEQFAAPAPELEAASLVVIRDGLERGVDARSISRAARLIQAYELMYWDALHEASG